MSSWSPQQERALKAVRAWLAEPYSDERQVFRLFGFAGTGKTTLAKEIAEDFGWERTRFCAMTGKAAQVLQQKGCHGATTFHRLVYVPKMKSQAKLRNLMQEMEDLGPDLNEAEKTKLKALIAEEQDALSKPFFAINTDSELASSAIQLVVLDECSMADTQHADDLMYFGKKILAMGDPAQLPPIYSDRTTFFIGQKPDIMLTEIHRQARDNPIIRMATAIRNGEWLDWGAYGDSCVLRWERNPEIERMATTYSQCIIGTNRMRLNLLRRVRELKGYAAQSYLPREGERLICLRNNHEEGLLNGQIFYATQDAHQSEYGTVHLRATEEDNDGAGTMYVCWPEYFTLKEGNEPDRWTRKEANEFTYGYVITCHKAQGSQWDNVVVFDDWKGKDHDKWLYTAVTRASQKVALIR